MALQRKLNDSAGTSLALIIRNAKSKGIRTKTETEQQYRDLLRKKRENDALHEAVTENRIKVEKKLQKFEPLDADEVKIAQDLHFCDFDCDNDEHFKNPKNIPVDELCLYIEHEDPTGVAYVFEVQAISLCWVKNWIYGCYDENITISGMEKLNEGLEWLVKLPFYKFWSQLILEKDTIAAVTSFLLHKKLFLFNADTDQELYNSLYHRISTNVYDILFRIIQTEHSKTQFLSLATHMAYVKKYHLLTREQIVPICRHYGEIPLTRLLLQQIFSLSTDLKTNALATIGIHFRNVLPILRDLLTQLMKIVTIKPENAYLGFLVILSFSEDLFTIRKLMSIYPPFIFIVQYLQLEKQLLTYMSCELFEAGKMLCHLSATFPKVDHQVLWDQFCRLTHEVIKIFRILIEDVINEVKRNDHTKNETAFLKSKMYVKRYIYLYEQVFSYNYFATEYTKLYDVEADNNMVLSVFPELDQKEKNSFREFADLAKRLKSTEPHANVPSVNVEPDGNLEVHLWNSLLELDDNKEELQKAITHELKKNIKNTKMFARVDEQICTLNKQYEQYLKKGIFCMPSDSDSSNSSIVLDAGPDVVKHVRKKSVNDVSESIKKISVLSHPMQEAINQIRFTVHHQHIGEDTDSSDPVIATGSKSIPFEYDETDAELYDPDEIVERTETALKRLSLYKQVNGVTDFDIDSVGFQYNESDFVFAKDEPTNHASSSNDARPSTSQDNFDGFSDVEDEGRSDINTDKIIFESLISEVKDILPSLGEGFIAACLRHYNNNSQDTISAILEETLPAALAGLDQSMPIIPEDPLESISELKGHERINVYDGDEFDQMTVETFDPNRIFRKKNKLGHKNIASLLDDKSDVKNLSERYAQYSLDMYDDDYDDTFDTYAPAIGDDFSEDKPIVRRPINAVQIDEVESSDDEDSESEETRNNNNFCEDPAVLRARADARRAQKYLNKGGVFKAPPPNKDVVGNAKGQGQDKTVIKNREKKSEHKSSRANHNRRSGASWKRSRGMIPS